VADTVDAYVAALEQIDSIAGRAFNWGGGPRNAVSLLTLLDEIAAIIGREPQVELSDWRPGDQRWFVADTRSIDQALGLSPRKGWQRGIRDLAAWLQTESDNSRSNQHDKVTA
jgi:CDP-paratose 2-epimerase